jgi:hypothetical protein
MNRSGRAFQALSAFLALWLAGCGSSQDTPSEQTSTGSGQLWVATTGIQYLFGVDIASGKMGLSLELATNPVEVSALKAANGRVWAGRSDGSLLMVNEATSKVEKTLSLAATTDPIEQLVLGSGAAYATAGSEREPHVFRIDTTSFKTQEASVISSTSLFSGFLYDGSVLWVLADNEFTLSKVDATTLSVLDSIPLGQNPSDPTGARVDKYGAGFMAQVGGKLWIIDSTTSQLLSVDKSTLVAKYVSDLKDLLEPSGSVIFTSNHDSLFLALADQGKIIRLDGQSGARVQTYTLETGAGRILTIGSDKLYLNSNNAGWDVSEIDIRSGEATNKYTNLQPAWLALE